MTGPDPSVAATRVAVRATLAALRELSGTRERSSVELTASEAPLVLVACSGGADSLALAAAAAFEAPRRGFRSGAIVVDHGLQPGSAATADDAARQCRALGLDPVEVVAVAVGEGSGHGLEAAAREARHDAYARVAHRHGAAAVLLGHTRDDQAEQVLLGLVRGSGTRSLAGMPARRGLLHRPFLQVSRAQTERACAAQGLTPWHDPHNDDERFTRVRARRLLHQLRTELDPAIDGALARTADLARADADALDALALDLAGPAAADTTDPADASWECAQLVGRPPAVTGRVWRIRAARLGIGALTSTHVSALEELTWRRGLGPASLPGGWRALRRGDRIHIEPPGRVE